MYNEAEDINIFYVTSKAEKMLSNTHFFFQIALENKSKSPDGKDFSITSYLKKCFNVLEV